MPINAKMYLHTAINFISEGTFIYIEFRLLSSKSSSAPPKRETSYTVAEKMAYHIQHWLILITCHSSSTINPKNIADIHLYFLSFIYNEFLFNISISPCYGHKILVDCKSHILSYNLYKIIKPSLWIGFVNIFNRLSCVESFVMA